MEFKLNSAANETHHVLVREATIKVTRMRSLGGVPLTIASDLPSDMLASKFMTKVMNLVELDDEMFTMLAEHQKEQD